MGHVAYGIRWLMEMLLHPIDLLPCWVGLTVVSVLSGPAMLWVFGKTTSARRLRKAKDRIAAAVYEVRLYLDSPRRVFSALGSMFKWTFAYLAFMLPAFLVLSLPFGLLLLDLDLRHGKAPLPLNRPVLVRVQLDGGTDGNRVSVQGNPSGFKVTAPPLFVEDERQVYLRVRVLKPGTHRLELEANGRIVSKILSADPSARKVSAEASRGLSALWAAGHEPALPSDGGVDAISVSHPDRNQRFLGMPWWGFWLVVSMLVAIALRRPMNVEV